MFYTSFDFVHEIDLGCADDEDVKRIDAAFKEGNKNVIFYSDRHFYATACALKFASDKENHFSNVVYAGFDRASYLYTSSTRCPSIDDVLKDSLCRPFILSDVNIKEYSVESYLERFEETADGKTLVIVDGFDAAALSPYMRRLFSLPMKLLVLAHKKMTSFDTAVMLEKELKYEKPCFDKLDGRQKELLMMLCVCSRGLEDKPCRLDEAFLRCFLGDLASELNTLIDFQYVKILPSGRVFVEENVKKQVFKELIPGAGNCRVFVRNVNKACSFRIMQNVKDISAQIYTAEDDYNHLASNPDLIELYSYFALEDENCGINLYNMLVTFMLENFVGRRGAFYTEHLKLKNLGYCLSLLSQELEKNEVLDHIYSDELYMDDELCEIYTKRIRAKLDIIRLCTSFLRNSTADMYKRLECVYTLLRDAMKYILGYAETSEYPDAMKMALADDVIRLCCESFDYFTVIDKDGIYHSYRDFFGRRRINYIGEREKDKLRADSIMFGYSPLTVDLYSLYARFLNFWLRLSRRVDNQNEINLLGQLYEEKLEERTETLASLNAHYVRLINGYESFIQLNSVSNKDYEILQSLDFDYLEKRIRDNKRYLRRGFDGGTKKGADAYAALVSDYIKESAAPINAAITVLYPDFPLSDKAYLGLKNRLVNALLGNRNITNHSLQQLLETVVFFYSDTKTRYGRRGLYEHIITELSVKVSETEAFLERMYHTVSEMYVKVNGEFADMLYEKYCVKSEFKEKYCGDYIAAAIYHNVRNIPFIHGKKLLSGAIETYALENNISTEEIKELYLRSGIC